METKNIWIICGMAFSLLLGGCVNKDSNGSSTKIEEHLVSVQNYKGEGYTLHNGGEMDKIAEAHRKEVESAVNGFFKEKYKTKVKVHNIVGNEDGATVFVESIGRVHYYTYAVVPIDIGEKRILGERVFSEQGQVEDGIKGGLYRLIFDEQFKKLDSYFERLVSEGEVVGKTVESLKNVGGAGYMTPYYFISTFIDDESIKPVYDLFVSNPDADIGELKNAYEESSFSPDDLLINVRLFMTEKDAPPSEEIFQRVVNDLDAMDGIPKGSYSLFLNDNKVYRDSFTGEKDNSLSRGHGNYIVNN